jgi:hypothetical protein
MDAYIRALIDLQEHLARHNVVGWAGRLGEWAAEWKLVSPSRAREHLLRTKGSLSGMGSLGDIVISAEAGDSAVQTPAQRIEANERLQMLVDRLYEIVTQALREDDLRSARR